ncbi:predicted protein [Plenodomus lingam JN3]|uniref:Predicted protein n=1 Tax=Leptosphaeria maculans (strain JN3 / isolate v23.1.3 / race Av1-4-5-6-7-8) TaxID=985895 RepID=E4ZH53_LEPMJ|nr:predicted protein [Plenodomus lingam JN3]CBX90623.1 predicted protein [Plenodomus lingam JN3]
MCLPLVIRDLTSLARSPEEESMEQHWYKAQGICGLQQLTGLCHSSELSIQRSKLRAHRPTATLSVRLRGNSIHRTSLGSPDNDTWHGTLRTAASVKEYLFNGQGNQRVKYRHALSSCERELGQLQTVSMDFPQSQKCDRIIMKRQRLIPGRSTAMRSAGTSEPYKPFSGIPRAPHQAQGLSRLPRFWSLQENRDDIGSDHRRQASISQHDAANEAYKACSVGRHKQLSGNYGPEWFRRQYWIYEVATSFLKESCCFVDPRPCRWRCRLSGLQRERMSILEAKNGRLGTLYDILAILSPSNFPKTCCHGQKEQEAEDIRPRSKGQNEHSATIAIVLEIEAAFCATRHASNGICRKRITRRQVRIMPGLPASRPSRGHHQHQSPQPIPN